MVRDEASGGGGRENADNLLEKLSHEAEQRNGGTTCRGCGNKGEFFSEIGDSPLGGQSD